MRIVLFVLACLIAAPAAAQTDNGQIARASHALAANWRPVTGTLSEASIRSACAGAVEEIATVDAALPAVLNADTMARVRAPHGLLIIPAGDDPAYAFFIPPADMSWFTSGMGAIAVLNEAQGQMSVRDAGGRTIALQLGRAGGHAVLRVSPPQGALLTFVGCAPIR